MTDTGDLIHGETYAFDFRTREPRPDGPRRLLVLLHGVGGDEHQLEALGDRVDDGTLVVLPRGQRSISGGRLGWFRESLSEDGPQVVIDELEEARLRLVDFLGQLQERFEVPPGRTVVAGFSQGGMLAATVALTAPARVAGFAMACGRIPPEIADALAPAASLAHLEALVLHGSDDEVLAVDWARRADRWLARLGIACRLHVHAGATHALTDAIETDIARWFADPGRPWSDRAPGAARDVERAHADRFRQDMR